jgi:ribonuclease D
MQENNDSQYIFFDDDMSENAKQVKHLSQLESYQNNSSDQSSEAASVVIDYKSILNDSHFISIMKINPEDEEELDEDKENSDPNRVKNDNQQRINVLEKKNTSLSKALSIYKSNTHKAREILEIQEKKIKALEDRC